MNDWKGNKNSTWVTLGASNHSLGERQKEDYYATEPAATEWLCKLETFTNPILEPSCGEGHISKQLIKHGYDVVSRDLVDRGYSIAVYPEGTRSEDCRIGRFHQGAFYIAEQLNLDIVPLILYGAGKVLPKKDKHLHKGIISLDVDRHFSPEEVLSLGTLKQRASWFRKYYKSRYDEVSDEYEQYA